MLKKNKIHRNAIVAVNLSQKGSSGIIMDAALNGISALPDVDTYKIIPEGNGGFNTYYFANNKSKLSIFLKELYYKLHSYNPIDGTYFNKYTVKVIKKIKSISKSHKKTIIHLHNVHHSQLNIFKLLKFLSNKKFPLIITIHDAWFYTGGCYCYDHVGCKEWQSGCNKCKFGFKKSSLYLNKKINLLNKSQNIQLVAVSNWVKNELLTSKINYLPVELIYGCTDIIKPENVLKYNFGEYAIGKNILISVSDYWNDWKGIQDLKKLSLMLPDHYCLVLVGGKIDIEGFKNTIHIEQVVSRIELANIYSSADVYISTSQTETLGLSTCEAQICGCPVITFGCGGSKETVVHGVSGYIVTNKDIGAMFHYIDLVVTKKTLHKANIVKNGMKFYKDIASTKYKKLYQSIFLK